MLLATDPGILGLTAAIVTGVGGAIGYLLRGGLRDTTADRIFNEINDLRRFYEQKWKEAEAEIARLHEVYDRQWKEAQAEIERDRLWKAAARAVLAKYANGDPAARELLGGMKDLEAEKPTLLEDAT